MRKLRALAWACLAAMALIIVLPANAQGQPVSGIAGEQLPTLAPLLEQVTPAVVNIAVVSEAPAATNPLYNDPFFRRFFDLPQAPQARPRMSAGSGVIIDADKGHILTNHHVVADAREIIVTLKDGQRLEAELVGSDQATDIALLRVEAENLVAIKIGDSDRLKVGDYVLAIGNPFGLGQTVTSGIISALGRTGINSEGYEDFIQTDASINPGNSGGALITLDGRLAGGNTAIFSPAGGNVGIGFAVPSNMAVAVMTQLAEHGEVRRGRIGVGIQDLTPDLAEAFNLGDLRGAVIANVEPGSLAEQADLQVGDVVIAVDDRPVLSSTDLRNRIGLTPVGEKVTLRLLRDNEALEITVTIAAENTAAASLAGTPFDGAVLRPAGGNGGVLVESVASGSPAARAGLQADDVIVAVNRRRVASPEDLRQLTGDGRRTLALEVIRGGSALLLVLR
ncbi:MULTISPECIES: DegQ family serine endoprotease [Devosia]|uniref:DegQ family serine endoprotease n=1 Tax=Devosia TaxID=46913 RepID=UPI001FEB43D2|nr:MULTISPECIES: DegQ family serine endoprotease [Devosia]